MNKYHGTTFTPVYHVPATRLEPKQIKDLTRGLKRTGSVLNNSEKVNDNDDDNGNDGDNDNDIENENDDSNLHNDGTIIGIIIKINDRFR